MVFVWYIAITDYILMNEFWCLQDNITHGTAKVTKGKSFVCILYGKIWL